jgi:hypothetical protein
MSVRKEVAEFTRVCDILLNGISSELTETECELLKGYTERMQQRLNSKESCEGLYSNQSS